MKRVDSHTRARRGIVTARINSCINAYFDRTVRPRTEILGRSWNSYLLWLVTGIVAGVALALSLTVVRGLSLFAMASVAAVAVLLSVLMYKGAAWFGHLVPKVEVAGKPLPLWVIWAGAGVYHYQVVIMASAIGVLRLLREPVLPYLDVAVAGLCLAQISGRIGCFTAGCCHGRPCALGVAYGDEHLAAGYYNYLSGVRLFPVQLLEVGWLLGILGGALSRTAPGEALSWYVITYGFGRFLLEFLRADSVRPFSRDLSEPQWVALGLMGSVVVLELAAKIPFHAWHAGATASLAFLVIVLALLRRTRRLVLLQLHQPHHLKELVEAVNWLCDIKEIAGPVEAVTSQGVRLAATGQTGHDTALYSLSYQDGTMRERTARSLAGLIQRVKYPSCQYEIAESPPGVFRLWFRVP